MGKTTPTGIDNGTDSRAKHLKRADRRGLKARMKELLLMLPRLVKLLLKLVRDPRVARSDKVILGGTILYVIIPLDFIPDMIPFIGQVDDAYLVAIAILRILNRTDPSVIAQHWNSDIDIKKLATSIANIATFFLPASIRAALTERIEVREPK